MKAYAIIDLQFGSTGKGLLSGYLAKRRKPDAVVCAFGPNAGHTFIEFNGTKWIHTMIPIGSIVPSVAKIFIGPGAVIDVPRMHQELMAVPNLECKSIIIHPHATVLKERHVLEEERRNGTRDTGSTRKGTGAALVDKVMREQVTAATELIRTPLEKYLATVDMYNSMMDDVDLLQIEGAQGFSLSHHHGFYPFVTSRDCTIHQLLSDCAVPAQAINGSLQVIGTCRTYPIRVNNRNGYSGGCYPDQQETTWEKIGVEPELTTVTKLQRRVFTFSTEQVRQAVRMSGVGPVFLNFANYIGNEVILGDIVDSIEQTGARVKWLGWGAFEHHIEEL